MNSDSITPECLQTIWDAHGLGKIEHMIQPSHGMVNQCWLINDAYVIRFDLLAWDGVIRFAAEKHAYNTLQATDVPVPRVVALDATKTLAPYDYLILTKLTGKTISETLAELPPATQHHLAYTAGTYLATIHSYPCEGFGLLCKIAASRPKRDWSTYVADFYQDYGQQAQALGVLPEGVLARVYAIMAKMQPFLATVQQGILIHGDYNLTNLLHHEGQMTGVLDFEWALSGDPAWDFRIDDYLESSAAGSRDAFYRGYTSRRPLSEHHAERVAFYRIGLYLDWLATFSPDDPTEVDHTLPLLMHDLITLEARL